MDKDELFEKMLQFVLEREGGYVNDPEDDNSPFVQHKRRIMKSKIEGVLNSSITAYSNRIWDKDAVLQ
mgnify:CR=1 FL=1